ncbi:putative beta-lysine N-acetyltransferase [Bacillus sp. DJP31]|uniref:putative beta-lysine N-acetyltransferase n=1 Tax=Bacillus sp. DJP31 TaxID=3409789 RepID=UPI003BB79FCE
MSTQPFYENKQIQGDNYYISACFDHFNQRLRVDDYRGNLFEIVNQIIEHSTSRSYSKVIIYARREHVHVFVEKGFLLEAILEGFFHGSHAYTLAMYLEQRRRQSNKWIKEDEIVQKVLEIPSLCSTESLPDGYSLRKGNLQDAEQLASLYNSVFQIYPTPLNDPEFIKSSMEYDTIFYVIEKDGTIVSAASACMNKKYFNAEISDCATLPVHRSHGLLKHLILQLEKEMLERKIFCVYSIARALSFGMNAALQQLQYKYKGRLTNNCYIFDKLEDMNVWVKDLS